MNNRTWNLVIVFAAIGVTSPAVGLEPISLKVAPIHMVQEQDAIESSRVEVVFSASGEVVQVNACPGTTTACLGGTRLLPARELQFYLGAQPIDLWRVQELSGQAATIYYDTATRLVEKVRFFNVAQEDGRDD
ncbi:hypothetical protein [Marinobacter sp. SS21]|uniref:hypothetical protein n=1 Tax=Marinobacter sp. SS21 TaxID=2979460 RepID=UPI002330790D|nr:hypothetical protein [Marinobacter sp. SS21]MDC0663027.1 hypothetical protein [Marinobacter sp. SS21]